jgi:PAS domain S-box-containing protein
MFPNRHENDWVTRDGRRRWIVWANSAVLNSAGEIDLILGTGVDITAKREMTEALRLSEERYQLAVRGSSAGIWDWNLRTDEVFFAPRFKEMLGYGDAEFPPHLSAFLAVLHPEDRPALDAAVAAHLANPEMRYDIEYRLRTKGGQYRWFQSRGEALRDGAGEAHRMVGSIVDLTARKEAENDLRRLNAELELRVGERTAQLAARVEQVERLNRDQNALVVELRTSQAEADRAATHLKEANANLLAANEELEAFSYSVSHDLRAPLRNISGFVELLVKRTSGRLDAEAERFMTVVAAEAARMGRLIDDLLAFSRLGRAEMTLRPVALDAIVTEVCAELKAESGTRPIEWIIGTLPTVRGDRALLHQVIANLLGNAVKFTARREVAVIEVGVLESGSAGPHVTIFVRDNGAGFNPKYLDKLFGVFQRLHNPRDFEGTGIGLANVKRIVTRHGGRVWAEGQVNGGAVFYFTLVIAPA